MGGRGRVAAHEWRIGSDGGGVRDLGQPLPRQVVQQARLTPSQLSRRARNGTTQTFWS
jgi:hypothetical protein